MTLPSAGLPTVSSIHHYRKGLFYLSPINLSQLHVHPTDIPTSFNLIMSILHLCKNVHKRSLAADKSKCINLGSSAIATHAHTPLSLEISLIRKWNIQNSVNISHTVTLLQEHMPPTLQLILSSLLASYFPKLFPTHTPCPVPPLKLPRSVELTELLEKCQSLAINLCKCFHSVLLSC